MGHHNLRQDDRTSIGEAATVAAVALPEVAVDQSKSYSSPR